jgi:flavodoxin
MQALVVYDSKFGNTKKIAEVIAKSLKKRYSVQVKQVSEFEEKDFEDVELFVAGAPTQGFRPSPDMKKFLKEIPNGNLKGKKVAAFDTRIDQKTIDEHWLLKIMVRLFGYAAEPIGKALQFKGGSLLKEPEGFCVTGKEGPLMEGELERAESWFK